MTRLHAGPEKVRSPYLRVRFTMSYRNNDRDGSRRREDRNHRPFRGGGGRGGRPSGRIARRPRDMGGEPEDIGGGAARELLHRCEGSLRLEDRFGSRLGAAVAEGDGAGDLVDVVGLAHDRGVEAHRGGLVGVSGREDEGPTKTAQDLAQNDFERAQRRLQTELR